MEHHWANQPDDEHPVRAEFSGGDTSYTTVEHAADILDFIDRDKGIRDLLMGTQFRSHVGTLFSIGEPGSLADRILG